MEPPRRRACACSSPARSRSCEDNAWKCGDFQAACAPSRAHAPFSQGEGVGRSQTDEGLVGGDCCLEPAGATPIRLATPSPSGEGGPTGRMRAGAKRPFVQLGTGKGKAIQDLIDILLR